MSRARYKHSRKTTVGVAALVLGLAAFLGLSSVAWSSTPAPVTSAQIQGPSRQQIQQFLEKDARKTEAAICRGRHRSQFPCRGEKALSGKPTVAQQLKLIRKYQNGKDPKCPSWEVKRPWTGYATIATEATVVCVQQIAGHDIGGGQFWYTQAPEIAILNLVGPRSKSWTTSTSLKTCFSVRVDPYWVFVLRIEGVVLCVAHLFVHAPVFPPAGRYHGKLAVVTYQPIWTNNLMLNVDSETLCYYC